MHNDVVLLTAEVVVGVVVVVVSAGVVMVVYVGAAVVVFDSRIGSAIAPHSSYVVINF